MTIDVYSQYFLGNCEFNGRTRHGALVFLQSDSENGFITYKVGVSFFPHDSENDFAVSYDAFAEEEIFSGKGRRSKKKEALYLENIKETANQVAKKIGGTIDWTSPLRDARYG